MNIYKKISKVMEDVGFLTNDLTVGKGDYAFRAISEAKVTLAVRNSLIKNGLVIFPVEQVHTREDGVYPDKDGVAKLTRISTIDVKYKIVDIDTEQFIEVVSSGTGCDANDKGVGKAITYAYKHMLLKTFAIPTGNNAPSVPVVPVPKAQATVVPPPRVPTTPATPPVEKPELSTKQLNQAIVRIEAGEFSLIDKLEQDFIVTAGQKEHLNQSILFAKSRQKQTA